MQIAILCLTLFNALGISLIAYSLGKVRMDQGVELGLLKWLWQQELKKRENR